MYDLKENCLRNLFVGLDTKVPLIDGTNITPINFDNAATTPVFKNVISKISEACEFYGSIGRGLGQKSELSTKIYSECRNYILDFFNAPKDKYTAIFVNNTTEGINRLSNILIESPDDIVVTTRMEHHSNDLPWRGKCNLKYVEVDTDGRLKIDELENILINENGLVKYVTLTAASNVTGYVNDLTKIAKLVHKYNSKLIVDGAQIVSHRKINILGTAPLESIDFLVFSAHKMYAPFGSGAIIGLKDYFNNSTTDLKGGGTVDTVLDNVEILLQTPERNEAGSPNFFGALALVESMKNIESIGYEQIETNEKILLDKALTGLAAINKVTLYGDNENFDDRLGIVIFNIDGINNTEVAHSLATLQGIAVRQGAFCAHPYVKRLLKLTDEEAVRHLTNSNYKPPGMVRASFGLYNSTNEIDIFLNTIELISKL